ncbi:unnamed protein product [Penicillium pancosmium]
MMANVEVSIDNDDVYNRFSPGRKAIITMVLVWSSFQCTLATTTVISAIPEVGATFHTTETTIAISNAVMLLCQVVGPILYAPIANTIGRRPILLATNAILFAFTLGTAFAPNLPASQVIATVVIGDIYPAVTRGRALGWLMVSTTLGPGIAPLLGGAIVSYTSWRVIFWTQSGMASLSVLLLAIFLPETIHEKKTRIFADLPLSGKVKQFFHLINPSEIITLLISAPGLAINAITVITLHWNMYSTLTPIREVLNPRFHLSSPLQAGLFYLTPSAGFLTGLFCGGQLSDWVVRLYIRRRGRRVPEDRLNSTVGVVGVALPACSLLYGWAVQHEIGGIPMVVVALFLQGVFQVIPFISLNVYCVDVMEGTGKSSLAVAGSYMVRNVAAAAGTAACLPAIEAIGVGWFMTIAAGLLVVAAGFLWLATRHGGEWRMRGEEKSIECSRLPSEK